MQEERGAPVEGEVASEQHPPLGDPDDRVVVGVGAHPEMPDLARVDVGPERRRPWRAPAADSVADPFVADDRGGFEQVVAERVVAMVMRVDEGADRLCRDGPDALDQRSGARLGGARVHGDDTTVRDEEAGVVDPPGPVVLHPGEDPVGHLEGLCGRPVERHGPMMVPTGAGLSQAWTVASVQCTSTNCTSIALFP